MALLLVVFGGISLLLATVGVYGVVAQVVADRTNEIGIRMALGARPGQILAQFTRQGMRAGIVGIACGFAAALYAQRWIAGMLFLVRPFDLPTFGLAGVGVFVALLGSVWWPARRASRIHPQRALHHE
jgi:ABC-type antimicrobial peptide transport system permease subunit